MRQYFFGSVSVFAFWLWIVVLLGGARGAWVQATGTTNVWWWDNSAQQSGILGWHGEDETLQASHDFELRMTNGQWGPGSEVLPLHAVAGWLRRYGDVWYNYNYAVPDAGTSFFGVYGMPLGHAALKVDAGKLLPDEWNVQGPLTLDELSEFSLDTQKGVLKIAPGPGPGGSPEVPLTISDGGTELVVARHEVVFDGGHLHVDNWAELEDLTIRIKWESEDDPMGQPVTNPGFTVGVADVGEDVKVPLNQGVEAALAGSQGIQAAQALERSPFHAFGFAPVGSLALGSITIHGVERSFDIPLMDGPFGPYLYGIRQLMVYVLSVVWLVYVVGNLLSFQKGMGLKGFIRILPFVFLGGVSQAQSENNYYYEYWDVSNFLSVDPEYAETGLPMYLTPGPAGNPVGSVEHPFEVKGPLTKTELEQFATTGTFMVTPGSGAVFQVANTQQNPLHVARHLVEVDGGHVSVDNLAELENLTLKVKVQVDEGEGAGGTAPAAAPFTLEENELGQGEAANGGLAQKSQEGFDSWTDSVGLFNEKKTTTVNANKAKFGGDAGFSFAPIQVWHIGNISIHGEPVPMDVPLMAHATFGPIIGAVRTWMAYFLGMGWILLTVQKARSM